VIAAIGLGLLAVLDAGFCGFRDAAGRDRRIDKGPYYRAAVRRGMVLGLLLLAVALVPIALVGTWADLFHVAGRMVQVYSAFAVLVGLALGAYAVSEGDLRTLATVAVLGPFTLIRPAIIAAGGVWGAVGAEHGTTAVIACAAATTMIAFEPLLSATASRTRSRPRPSASAPAGEASRPS